MKKKLFALKVSLLPRYSFAMAALFILASGAAFGQNASSKQDSIKQDVALAQYTGKYIFPEGSVPADALVSLNGSSLIIKASLGTASLKQVQGDLFTIPLYDGKVEFLRDGLKNINGMKVQVAVADIDMEGKRVSDTAEGKK